jgi:ribosomal protein S18 acetylase RimI-like enzyme
MVSPPGPVLIDLEEEARNRAEPLIKEAFEGYYRWHAKRSLREVPVVRGAELDGELVGVSMLERLAPEVGYVFYLAVGLGHRGRGIGRALLDDAIERFRTEGVEVVYGAVQAENAPSLALFRSRGFRIVERKEPGYREGGLGAWGLRSRMRLVSGELLLGLRVAPSPAVPGPRS